jgi:hypothetical protein
MVVTLLCLCAALCHAQADDMPFVQVAKDKKSFTLDPSGKAFTPWGFNYDHDTEARLFEDYWEKEWDKVEAHFGQMKKLGASVIRIHLQLGKFMDGPDKPNGKALDRLGKLLDLAERLRLYLDLTGLGCYHKKDVPAWYDKLSEKERWDVQARFWRAVAGRCADSPAVFCYDLMNEPVVSGGKRKDGDWLGPPFAEKHFVQFINLDQQGSPGKSARSSFFSIPQRRYDLLTSYASRAPLTLWSRIRCGQWYPLLDLEGRLALAPQQGDGTKLKTDPGACVPPPRNRLGRR